MQELSKILSTATSRIKAGYFQLSVEGGLKQYRERVYCYELYHQMRCLWPGDSDYFLNGEVDKTAHPVLAKVGADKKKPDLLVHGPGDSRRNHAIIEVKYFKAKTRGIDKDFETVALFRDEVGYQRGICLFFGYGADKAFERVKKRAAKVVKCCEIEVWLHASHETPAMFAGTV